MVDATSQLTGQQAIRMAFQKVGYAYDFDGV